jgi:TolA-binding protein
MRHALRVTRKAVFLFALFTVSAVWSRPVTAQPRETPASPEQQAQDVQQLKAKLQQLEQMIDEMKGKLNRW